VRAVRSATSSERSSLGAANGLTARATDGEAAPKGDARSEVALSLRRLAPSSCAATGVRFEGAPIGFLAGAASM
jgi:hypothetical protein